MDARSQAEIYRSIAGGDAFLRWFGCVPSFHDAEILGLLLERKGISRLMVHCWNTTSRLNELGQFIEEKHAVVTYLLDDVFDLQLEGFNHQNVIDGLRLSPLASDLAGEPKAPGFELALEHCYGLSGYIRSRGVQVDISPASP